MEKGAVDFIFDSTVVCTVGISIPLKPHLNFQNLFVSFFFKLVFSGYIKLLTLILLNKLSLPHPFLTVNQSDNSVLFVHINSQTE